MRDADPHDVNRNISTKLPAGIGGKVGEGVKQAQGNKRPQVFSMQEIFKPRVLRTDGHDPGAAFIAGNHP
ncbi:hypothetical protein D3C73_1409680 [compost metagenome]